MQTSSKAACLLLILIASFGGCASTETRDTAVEVESEAIARTEFTERIENFFEYDPLRAGQSSQFRIHLTDLSDGSPVENATVTMTVRHSQTTRKVSDVVAQAAKVTGIYVADMNIPQAGEYDIEFHIRNSRLDERLPLSDFKVE